MEPAQESFRISFPSSQNPGRYTPLDITSREEDFYTDFFNKTLVIVTYIASRFFDSNYTFIRGAIAEIDRQEKVANERYPQVLQERQEWFRRTLQAGDPMCRHKLAVKYLWECQRLADSEVGHPCSLSLFVEEKGGKVFRPQRAFAYLLDKEPEVERTRFYKLLDKLKLSDTEICKKSERVQKKLQQLTLFSLREAYGWQIKNAFAFQNNREIEKQPELPHLSPDASFSDKPGFLNADLINRLSSLIFRTIEKSEEACQGTTDFELACRVAQGHLHIEMISMKYFKAASLKKRGSSGIVAPEIILRDIQELKRKIRPPEGPSKTEEKKEESFGDRLLGLFSKASEPVASPSFFSKTSGKDKENFYKEWLYLRTILTVLSDLLRTKSNTARGFAASTTEQAVLRKKNSLPHPKKKNAAPLTELPPEDAKLEREGSSFIHSYHPKNFGNADLLSTLNVLEETITLMDFAAQEIAPSQEKPRKLILRNNTPSLQGPDQKLRLLELIGILEALIIGGLNQVALSKTIWEAFFAHLQLQEKNQNDTILRDFNAEIAKYEKDNEELKKKDPTRYLSLWARKHFETQLKIGASIRLTEERGHLTLPLMQDNLTDPLENRILVRVLNRTEGLPANYTVSTLIEACFALRMEEVFRIACGDKGCNQHTSAEIHVVTQLRYWLRDEKKKILRNHQFYQAVNKQLQQQFYKKLSHEETSIVLVSGLLDGFSACRALKTNSFFPSSFQGSVLKEGAIDPQTISPRLKDLEKEFVSSKKGVTTREANYSSSDLTAASANPSKEIEQLGNEARQVIPLFELLPGSPKVMRDQLAVCVKLIAAIANNLFKLPSKP